MTAALPRWRRPARRLFACGALLVLLYAGVYVYLWIVQERLVFKVQPLSPQQADEVRAAFPEASSIRLAAADGTSIHAWYRPATPAPSSRRVLLYFGANNEQVHWKLERRPEFDGWDLLLVDYRGYGLSRGRPSQAAFEADALRWLALARTGGAGVAKADSVVVMGTSIGSYLATYVAAARPVDGVVLLVPYDSAVGIAQSMMPIYPISWIFRNPFPTIDEAPKVRAPTIFFVALRDQTVRLARSQRLYDSWGSRTREWVELKDANHYTVPADPRFWQRLGEFLRRL